MLLTETKEKWVVKGGDGHRTRQILVVDKGEMGFSTGKQRLSSEIPALVF